MSNMTLHAPDTAAPQADTDERTQIVVAATTAFLNLLSVDQRTEGRFPFTPQETATAVGFTRGRMTFVGEQCGQAVWSNLPVSDVPRPGLSLGSLNPAQHSAALHILQTLLSPEGYQKVVDIMDSDQVLSESGTPYDAGITHYTLGVFGTPSAVTPWMLQFGGHHLALNAVMVGPNISLSPILTGAQPATYQREGQIVRPLGKEKETAFRLMNAFSAAQQQKAMLNDRSTNLVLGPGQDGRTLPPQGLPAPEMTETQQVMLLDLIAEWVGILTPVAAALKLAQIRADLRRTYFAWYGSTTNPSPVCFRISGPTLHIEFAHQQWDSQTGGVNHIHTVYRDPTNDYGRGFPTG